MANAINWFEIPASNFKRACSFYQEVLNQEIHTEDMMGTQMGFLHNDQDSVGGAIVHGEGYAPSGDGALLYLNGGTDLSDSLNRVEPAGGKVIRPKTKISDEIGYMAIFMDTEGNKLALHSPA